MLYSTIRIPHSSLMMKAVRTSETSVDSHFTWQYIPEDNSEHHTRCRENFEISHTNLLFHYLPGYVMLLIYAENASSTWLLLPVMEESAWEQYV
jgi:hypothetical protein